MEARNEMGLSPCVHTLLSHAFIPQFFQGDHLSGKVKTAGEDDVNEEGVEVGEEGEVGGEDVGDDR